MPQTTPLTPEQIETVKSVYDAIGVLTVRDNVTFPEGKAAEYGKHFAPVRKHMTNGREIRDPLIRHRRVISTVFADSHIFKGGVPIGVTEIWQPKGIAELGGDPTLQLMAHKNDICMSELKRLKSLAYGTKWMSQEERLADERMKEEMRQKRKISDLDPAAATGKALADALATALSNAGISGGGAAVALQLDQFPDAPLGVGAGERRQPHQQEARQLFRPGERRLQYVAKDHLGECT